MKSLYITSIENFSGKTAVTLGIGKRLQAEGRIRKLADRFHGAPTNRSQKTMIEQDCVELLARVREDGSDAVVIVAN